MEFITIKPLAQKVSRIALGTWSIGGSMWGGTDEKQAFETILSALDRGITIIDTAPVYGFGRSEEILGKALQEYGQRSKIVIATKAGLSWSNGQIWRDSKKDTLQKELEASLKRLKVDTIDLYQIHWPDPSVPFSETADALNQFYKQGKIRAIGVSNYSKEMVESFQEIAPVHTIQSPFNIFEREIENDLLPFAKKEGIATLGYGPLCRGLLTGKITKTTEFSGDDIRKTDPKFQEPARSQYLECVTQFNEWLKDRHQTKSLTAFALRWVLDKGIDIALWGCRRPEQLAPLDEIWDWKLSQKELQQLDQIVRNTIPNSIGINSLSPSSKK